MPSARRIRSEMGAVALIGPQRQLPEGDQVVRPACPERSRRARLEHARSERSEERLRAVNPEAAPKAAYRSPIEVHGA